MRTFRDSSRGIHWSLAIPAIAQSAMESLIYRRGDKIVGKLESWETICLKYTETLTSPDWDNVIVDTWRELWTICHRAYLQELQGDNPDRKNLIEIEYATPNSWMDNWMAISKGFSKNLLLISHERPVRVPHVQGSEIKMVEDPSGKMELDGYRHTPRKVDWSIVTGIDNPCIIQNHSCYGWHFFIRIEKSPIGQQLVGQKIIDPTYEKIMERAQMMGLMPPTPQPIPQVLETA